MSLRDAATHVRHNAYAPYSRFKVGAAIRAVSGEVYTGVNVENVAYPEGTCAEAGAIAPPCGGCRQKIAEFADPSVVVTLCTTDGATLTMTVADLLPGVFSAAHMSRT
jgi:cytidine deaminase